MAVYSPINKKELVIFLKDYDIGSLITYEGILEGIENTNYKIITSKNTYILTIFEKRVKKSDLPFFIEIKKHLIIKQFLCPRPIPNKNKNYINKINDKSCVLVSYLKGNKINIPSKNHCKQIGAVLSNLHISTSDFKGEKDNYMNFSQWNKIFSKCKSLKNNKYEDIINIIEDELIFLKKKWPNNLPKGIIHADVFKDNVFFIKNKFSGLIDFYFSCSDFFAYDIALTINAWCFNKDVKFQKNNFIALINGYENNRLLKNKEKKFLPILLRGAAIRILLTRLYDTLFFQKGAFVEPKDPYEYFKILKFHQNNKKELL